MDSQGVAGVTSQTCTTTNILYFQKLFTAPGASGTIPGLILFLNGIGLDREAFLPFLQHVSLPSVRMTYPYKTLAHLAITVPGFEAADAPGSENLVEMADQASAIAEFLRARVAELAPEKIVIYAFSYGSDLMVPFLEVLAEDPRLRPLLARVVLAEINVNLESCFITSRIRGALEGVSALPAERRMRAAHNHFFTEVLKAYAAEDISTTLMADLAQYFAVIITKNWYQLASNCREVTSAPQNRLRRLLGLMKGLPTAEMDFVFSYAQDLAAFEACCLKQGERPPNVRVHNATEHEHFFHVTKEGILENLLRNFQQVL